MTTAGRQLDVPSGRPAAVPTPQPGDPRLRRLSLNTATTKGWTLRQAVDGAVRAGIPAVGLWRDRVAEVGVAAAARTVADSGLRVSSLCRGGFLTATDLPGRRAALDDNRRAIEEAAVLGAADLVIVAGGLPPGDRDLARARARVGDRIAELVAEAAAHRVRLVLEPLHPLYVADRAVLSTLGQVLEMAAAHPPHTVGVMVDTFHVWWDPELEARIAQAGREGRLAGYQVSDWILPIAADPLLARGMMGDGHVDFDRIGRAVGRAGYTGDVEFEIFNADVWAADGHAVLATAIRRYVQVVLPSLDDGV